MYRQIKFAKYRSCILWEVLKWSAIVLSSTWTSSLRSRSTSSSEQSSQLKTILVCRTTTSAPATKITISTETFHYHTGKFKQFLAAIIPLQAWGKFDQCWRSPLRSFRSHPTFQLFLRSLEPGRTGFGVHLLGLVCFLELSMWHSCFEHSCS